MEQTKCARRRRHIAFSNELFGGGNNCVSMAAAVVFTTHTPTATIGEKKGAKTDNPFKYCYGLAGKLCKKCPIQRISIDHAMIMLLLLLGYYSNEARGVFLRWSSLKILTSHIFEC